MRQACSLSIHDDTISAADVLLNLALLHRDDSITAGDSLRLIASNHPQNPHDAQQVDNHGVLLEPMDNWADNRTSELGQPVDHKKGYYFMAKEMDSEQSSKLAGVQISMSLQIAQAFGLKKGSSVLLSKVNGAACNASHVEITFRDEYLTRADMWHLVTTELARRTVYKDMKIWSMRTIKASVRNVYVNGEKVQSAFFAASTKPIFRSESARYVLFIQMSKEMWDFDASGSGEIMFSKAINGFLPELFKRWYNMNAKHLVTIVLFTRIEYDRTSSDRKGFTIKGRADVGTLGAARSSHQDYYRVVVSDMSSAEGERILGQLKAEFKVFLRDVCICKPTPGSHFSLGLGFAAASTSELPEQVIWGKPCGASHGNILEAINLASSGFSRDHIDRDLVRTGVSIAVVTPGTGVFEVDYDQLLTTTNNLVANGIGIDLICLSRMPLHSVPLFKYWQRPSNNAISTSSAVNEDWFDKGVSSPAPDLSIDGPTKKLPSSQISYGPNQLSSPDHWIYAMPQWVDVSFWTSSSDEGRPGKTVPIKHLNVSSSLWQPRKAFRPRVRMYELQMMGIMEGVTDDISIPYLMPNSASRLLTKSRTPSRDLHPRTRDSFEEISKSIKSQAGNQLAPIWTPNKLQKYRSSITSDLDRFVNQYDEDVFLHPQAMPLVGRDFKDAKAMPSSKSTPTGTTGAMNMETASSYGSFQSLDHTSSNDGPVLETTSDNPRQTFQKPKQFATSSGAQENPLSKPKPNKFSRQLSYGLRGFGNITPKAIASTELSAEFANSPSLLKRTVKSQEVSQPRDIASLGGIEAAQGKNTSSKGRSQDTSSADPSVAQASSTLSRPIPIRKNTVVLRSDNPSDEATIAVLASSKQGAGHNQAFTTLASGDAALTSNSIKTRSYGVPAAHLLSPDTIPTPWMTVINPCNPSKADVSSASRLGRWQHIFPRPLRASKIKWKSLCSPAAVPITTDDFPTFEELGTKYTQSSYELNSFNEGDSSENLRSHDGLLREMTAIRLSHGFQIVVGRGVAMRQSETVEANVFDRDLFNNKNSTVYLAKSNSIHRLRYTQSGGVEVECFIRNETSALASDISPFPPITYKPAIRTMLADGYKTQEVCLYKQPSDIDWHKLDVFLAGIGKQQPANLASALRFWRARFVLIPVDPPANSRRPMQSFNEDNEEEMRLEGIRKLTQIWQKFRYVSPEERRFQVALRQRKDTNPLDIMYQTRNPSAIVAAEKENIGEIESASGAVELLPESELYQRSDLNLASLAQTIQSDKGVRMVDRRWHWRLHYSCFIGFEMTTWLLQNFRDIETRQDAVELGNKLMYNGLFQHVEQRHNFRDGNYFYQISSNYRTPRPESKSWFGTRKSVPATPISEVPGKDFPNPPGSGSSSRGGETSGADGFALAGEKQRLGVALSKSLLYDVDHRKRSYRRELITLHYDRLHNPDNCYHIRIEWMNVTAKLIEDAIVSWATTVDRYGLKLVEVPLAEASAVTDMHPFRAPYLVELAHCPPSQQPQDLTYMDAKSFSPQTSHDVHFYQRAILNKFRYVLDFEAARDFPPDVEVAYSWGKPDYRYAQYIHQSGLLLVQITDEGHFLLLANRLYNIRNPIPQDSGQQMPDANFRGYRSSAHLGSPRSSPYSSPMVRPRSDVAISGHQKPISGYTTPEELTSELESFCQDTVALDTFYNEAMYKIAVPGRHTPRTENNIPALGLPPSASLRDRSPASGNDDFRNN
ncbi:MAG: hypothetical protein Q9195_003734 [Heterodermia aff. obscurata]